VTEATTHKNEGERGVTRGKGGVIALSRGRREKLSQSIIGGWREVGKVRKAFEGTA